MKTLAPGVHQLKGMPPHAINVYLVEDVLVDAGTPRAEKRILRELASRDVSAHLVTHAHPDHYGSSHALCERLGLSLWTGAIDADALEAGDPPHSQTRVAELMARMKMPPGHPVARRLHEGDEVAGFRVLDTPGHTPGHIALWRESDRVLIAGDVFFNVTKTGQPPRFLSSDPAVNRESMRRLAELRPALAVFGHGPPLRDPARLAQAAMR
jgi:glyoxylase-like metal-dependent hydrolase (beta-lactamase superfamily II)